MADYDFRYRLQSVPEPRVNGSGNVAHDVYAMSQPQGDGGYTAVPGYHQTVLIAAADLTVMNDMPDSTGGEKTAKNAVYKNLIYAGLETSPPGGEPVTWDGASLELYVDANDLAAFEADRVDTYVTVTLGLSYPVDFAL